MNFTALNSGHILGAALLILLPLAIISPKGIALLFIAAALIAYFLGFRQGARLPKPPRLLLILLGGMWILGVASLAWTIDKSESLGKLGQLFVLFTAGLVLCDAMIRLEEKNRRLAESGLAFGFLLTTLLIAVEILAKGPIARLISKGGFDFAQTAIYGMWFLKNAATLAAIFVWPTIILLWRKAGARVVLLLLIIVAWELYVIRSASASLAFAAGGGVFALSLRWPSQIMKLLMLFVLILVAASPILPRLMFAQEKLAASLSGSAHHRLTIWNFAAEKIAQRPLLGWGLDSSRNIPGGKEIVPFVIASSDGSAYVQANEEKLPLHPHNGFLQLWLELGIAGATLGALLSGLAVYKSGNASRPGLPRAAAQAACTAAIIVFSLSYGAWQSWWVAALWFLAAALIALTGETKEEALP
jgi:exopolysaccharide production protein ExoQ